MTRDPNEGWSDERLGAAYRSMAARPAPAGLVARTVLAVEAAPARPRFGLVALRRRTTALAGLAAAAAVIAIVGASLMLRLGTGPAATSSGRSASGLPVQSVEAVLKAKAAGEPGPDRLFAVHGWLYIASPHHCPMIPTSDPFSLQCGWQDLLLTQSPLTTGELFPTGQAYPAGRPAEPAQPHLYVHVLDGAGSLSAVPEAGLPARGDPHAYGGYEVVLFGHFDDRRASTCAGADQKTCRDAFVIDQLAELDGKAQPASVWTGLDAHGKDLEARMSSAAVEDALRPVLDPRDAVVSIALTQKSDAASIGAPKPSVTAPALFWFVRVAGPAPHNGMIFAGGDSGWLTVDDATGKITGAGGWGRFGLSTSSWRPGDSCAGLGLQATVHGDPADPNVVWLQSDLDGSRFYANWPAGFWAKFDPTLEIVDASGKVVLHEGSRVTGACADGSEHGVVTEW